MREARHTSTAVVLALLVLGAGAVASVPAAAEPVTSTAAPPAVSGPGTAAVDDPGSLRSPPDGADENDTDDGGATDTDTDAGSPGPVALDARQVANLSRSAPLVAVVDQSGGQTAVTVEVRDPSVLSREPFAGSNATVVAQYENRYLIRAPVGVVREMARSGQLASVRRPLRPVSTDVVSEGVGAMGADRLQAAGLTGDDVRVGIMDFGFDVDNPEIAANVAETNPVAGGSVGSGYATHGTAVAEVVVDVAPDSELYLASIGSATGYASAVDWMVANDVDVVVTSLGFYGQPGDGTGFVSEVADRAVRDHDVVWVNSAGNSRQGHWQGTYSDPDGNGVHNFTAESETNWLADGERLTAGTPASIWVSWDDWPETDDDYNVGLYRYNDGDPVLVAESTRTQSGSQPPQETISTRVPTSGRYFFSIVDAGASGRAELEVTVGDYVTPLGHQVLESSILAPATGERVVGVAASNWDETGTTSYSSMGPTNDGRLGIDVSAPTAVSTTSYPTFAGTSASSPHVGGLAVLLRDAAPAASAVEVTTAIQDGADGVGTDYRRGHGAANATASVDLLADAGGNDWFEPNDGFDTAASVGAGTYSELRLVDGEDDYYAVDLSAGESLSASIEFDHEAGDLDLSLYGPDRDRRDESTSRTDGEAVAVENVSEAGTYYVAVHGPDGDTVPYSMTVEGGTERDGAPANDRFEPNDRIATAAPVEPGTYDDLRIVDGERDHYAVEVSAGESLSASIDFEHATGDLDLALAGPSGAVLDSSVSVSDGESVSADVAESGTYYVVAYGYDGASAPYSMTVETGGDGEEDPPEVPDNDRFEPNDRIESAAAVDPGTYEDLQIVDGEDDYYAVEVSAGESLSASIEFSHDTGDLDLVLLDPAGDPLDSSVSVSDDESVAVDAVAESGTYYVVPYGYDGASAPYSMTVETGGDGEEDPPEDDPAENDRFEPNDAFEDAAAVDAGTYEDLQQVDGEDDYYAVEVSAGESLSASVDFDHDDGNVDLFAFGPDERMVDFSVSVSDGESVSVDVEEAGTHYVLAIGEDGETIPYSLTVETGGDGEGDPPEDDPGENDRFESNDDFESAATVDPGTYEDLQMVDGEDDYYAVEVSAGESLAASIDFEHEDGNLDLYLYRPDERMVDFSVSADDGESVSADVEEAGTYYVLASGHGDATAPYSLTVEREPEDD